MTLSLCSVWWLWDTQSSASAISFPRDLFAKVSFCLWKHLLSLDLVFSCLGGRSLSDSIFANTFVSLFSPLPDSLLRVKIINPEVGDPLSGSGTDVQGATSAHMCACMCRIGWRLEKTTTNNRWAHRLGRWISDLCLGTEGWAIDGLCEKTGSRFWDWGARGGLKQVWLFRAGNIFLQPIGRNEHSQVRKRLKKKR